MHEGKFEVITREVFSDMIILGVTLMTVMKLEGRAIGVKRNKECGDIRDVLSYFFAGDTVQKPFYT